MFEAIEIRYLIGMAEQSNDPQQMKSAEIARAELYELEEKLERAEAVVFAVQQAKKHPRPFSFAKKHDAQWEDCISAEERLYAAIAEWEKMK